MTFHKHTLLMPGESQAGLLADFLMWNVYNEPVRRAWHHYLHPEPFKAQEHTSAIWLNEKRKRTPRPWKTLSFRNWLWGKFKPRHKRVIKERLATYATRTYYPNERINPHEKPYAHPASPKATPSSRKQS